MLCFKTCKRGQKHSQNQNTLFNLEEFMWSHLLQDCFYIQLKLRCPSYYIDFVIFSVEDVILRLCIYCSVHLCFRWRNCTDRNVKQPSVIISKTHNKSLHLVYTDLAGSFPGCCPLRLWPPGHRDP